MEWSRLSQSSTLLPSVNRIRLPFPNAPCLETSLRRRRPLLDDLTHEVARVGTADDVCVLRAAQSGDPVEGAVDQSVGAIPAPSRHCRPFPTVPEFGPPLPWAGTRYFVTFTPGAACAGTRPGVAFNSAEHLVSLP